MLQEDLDQIDKLLQKRLNRFATKEDVKQSATKDDLKQFATKDDLKQFATKEELRKELERVVGDATAVVLEAVDNNKADRKQVTRIDQRVSILESKVALLEQQ